MILYERNYLFPIFNKIYLDSPKKKKKKPSGDEIGLAEKRFKSWWLFKTWLFKSWWKLLFKNIFKNTCGWKNMLKYVKCCLKTENDCLKTQTKYPLMAGSLQIASK